MAISEELRALVDQMPDADDRDMYNTDVDKEKIDKAVARIQKGGRENVLGLIDMLAEPGSDENVKPHYALHCLINGTLIAGDKKAQKEICAVMAGELAADRAAHVKDYLCQELQWGGGPEAAAALGKLLTDPELVEPAAMALVAIREGAGEQFRRALPKAQGVCRRNVVQGLGAIEDREAIPALREALGDADPEVCLAAGWGLSRMGDAGSVERMIRAADVKPHWQRTKATRHCLVLAEQLAAAGKRDDARKIYRHLADTRTGADEKHIRLVAMKGLVKA